MAPDGAGGSDRLRVGHNLLFLHPRLAGVRVYAVNLLGALLDDPQAQRAFTHTVYVSMDGLACLDEAGLTATLRQAGAVVRVLGVRGAHKLRKLWWEQFRLPSLASRDGIDVLHSYDYSTALPGRGRRTVTVHDLRYLDPGSPMGGRQRMARHLLLARSVRRSVRIATVSEYTRRELIQHLAVPDDLVTVVADAPDPLAVPPAGAAQLRALGVESPFVLSVGTLYPHKNHGRLLDAFARLRQPALMLVLAGRGGPYGEELRRRAADLGVARQVVFTGFVERPLLAALYREARAFVLPSMHEGFGIPVLEAMQHGVPTACADAGALREVAGDATHWFDPLDVESMRGALAAVLDDEALRERLRERGHAQAARFTWARSAAALRELLLAAAGRGVPV